MVLQHQGHVRRLSTQGARRLIQGLLSIAGELLDTAVYRAVLDVGEAAEGLQRVGGTSYRDVGAHLAELSVSLYVHGVGRVHYT